LTPISDIVDPVGWPLTVLHLLPGHGPGSIALLDPGDGTLFSGDVVYDDVLLDRIAGSDPAQYRTSLDGCGTCPSAWCALGTGPASASDGCTPSSTAT
jgi:glyoxylase-like metal-dependent hydrolase (beta-lactamase superfamily II)